LQMYKELSNKSILIVRINYKNAIDYIYSFIIKNNEIIIIDFKNKLHLFL
jgi:hypothetical protein